ncbi:MAG: Biopolymer transport protein ExbD [Chlamydiae bacterium]|nr:Biopolymer transport protein ExbD [Chlamydiota bacterium]
MRQKRLVHLTDSAEDQGSINLTPLIDVVFVVLILFILIAPMLETDKVKLANGPAREGSAATNPSSLVIHVHEDNTLWINKREIQEQSLRPLLQALHAKNPKLIPQLYQDRGAFFGTYQLVKNAVEEAGFEELDVILEPGR